MTWRTHRLTQTARLPRDGVAGVWDRLVARVTGRPVRVSERRVVVSFEFFEAPNGAVVLGQVTAEFVQ